MIKVILHLRTFYDFAREKLRLKLTTLVQQDQVKVERQVVAVMIDKQLKGS